MMRKRAKHQLHFQDLEGTFHIYNQSQAHSQRSAAIKRFFFFLHSRPFFLCRSLLHDLATTKYLLQIFIDIQYVFNEKMPIKGMKVILSVRQDFGALDVKAKN